jgi:DNA primase
VLYNLHRAKETIRKEDRVILVEGYMDAIGVTAAGFRSVVASCGTALTEQQVRSIKRHSRKIAVNFDPDAPGANAAERSINLLLEEGMHVRIMELDDDLDPDEYCKERGAAAYQERIEHAKGYFYWLADRARAKYDIHTSEGVVAVLQFLLPAVQRISDPLERSAIAGDVANYVGVDRGMVLDSFKKAATNRGEKELPRPRLEIRPDERVLLNALVGGDPEIRHEVVDALKPIEAIGRFPSRRIFQAIFTLHESGARFSFDEVHARVEESDQNLLAEAVLNEDRIAERDEVLAAIASVRRSEVEDQRRQMKHRIRDAERSGSWEEALRLTAELQNLERETRARK